MTDLLKWDSSCRVGVQEFDEAHKSLIAIGNKAIRAVVNSNEVGVMDAVMDELIAYTQSHFTREEEVLKESGYPGYQAHRAEHKKLISEVRLFKSKYIAGNHDASEVSVFLIGWIVHHIKERDKDYSDHLNAKGIR